MPTIRVASGALRDEETPVRIEGLDPGATVTLVARSEGWYDGGCESRTTFEADDDGVVDTGDHAPVDGSYGGVAPMGWLWSMAPDHDADGPDDDIDPVEISLEARADGEALARATTVRRETPAGVTREAVDGKVYGDLFVPADDGPAPGVLVLHGSGGRPSRGIAALLAAHGYAAFALKYFGDPDPLPDQLREVPVEYFDDAASVLRGHEAVADDPPALYGTSKGAEAALVVAARYDWPEAVVAVVPSAHRWQCVDWTGETDTGSWTADGEVLPYVPYRAPPAVDDDGKRAIAPVYANSPERVPEDRLAAARIPVERFDGDVLLVSGGDDRMWPSADFADAVADRLAERETGSVEHLSYDRAGHAIAPPYRPTAGTVAPGELLLGGTPAANARAAADYWPQALDVLADGSE